MFRTVPLFLCLCAASLTTRAADDLVGPHECAAARVEAYRRVLASEAAVGLADELAEDQNGGVVTGFADDTDVLHYQLELEVKPTQRWIGGTNAMSIVSLVDDLALFRFRLADVFNISDVRIGDSAATWTRVNSETIEVTLDRTYMRDEQFILSVSYDGKPVSRGFGSIEFSGNSFVWTLSETWFAYTWVPLKDELTDKATADLAFIVPKNLSVASNGVLVGTDDLEGDRKRFRWQTSYQTATYLFSFSIASFKQYEKTWTYGDIQMPVQFFIYSQNDNPNNRNAWFRTVDMLTVFSDQYGVYPFAAEKYGIANFGWGGGMEHQTCTSQGGFSEYLNAHELAHQWWGDNVTCETWHDIWLNEGFATYSEAIWIENEPGKGGRQALIDAMRNRKPGWVGDSVYVYDDTNFDRIFDYSHTYLKGGWVLHMLRHVVGDDRFFEILREYRGRHEGGSATTEDFRAAAESVHGVDLAWFFDQWVYGIGAPSYRHASRSIDVGGRKYLEVYVEQVQSGDWPTFRMPIDLALTIGGDQRTQVVWNDQRKEHYLVPVEDTATGFAFDPEGWILWTDASGRGFVEGPPKVIDTWPAPDAEVTQEETAALRVGFHKNVSWVPNYFVLTDERGDELPVSVSYDAATFTATITPEEPLVRGSYALTASSAIQDKSKGIALDGEIPGGQIVGLVLPSGDGAPGGDAVIQFEVVSPRGDLNCDGRVNFDDIDPFVAAVIGRGGYEERYPECDWNLADVNRDGGVDFNDIDPFVELLTK